MTEPLDAVAEAIENELRLIDPEVRSSAPVLATMLDPGYREIGTSGRLWDRDTIIAELTAEATTRPGPLTVSRMAGVELSPGLVHLTFDTEYKGRRSHRSSLWRLTGSGWLLYFHQATPFVDDPFTES
ncbi:nuclear transport factor 2 family protein [Streptomyces sp. NBC_01218]|uniref:nuclear transport factor 2 family protein n=1 Tax=unclassified Streptomyces TaxID=2593676 RepID=UPI0023B8BB10|nr:MULTISPECIES: nuclear transport factor 2 family protein [unclassified Streptomyces]WEH38942.1 nuclear transport factor 2 family protein [Streptomyces sp. AM 2-1-1]WSQ50603.1 nuclear transport factor 2 family protein [Streptomyces sp. NBC_01218]